MELAEKEFRSDLQFSLLTNELRSAAQTETNTQNVLREKEARIATYKERGKPPVFTRIDFTSIDEFTRDITSEVLSSLENLGSTFPAYVVQELVDNFIFAQFSDVSVSILEEGRVLVFADHGPGIENKKLSMQAGFSSATGFQRKYIRATGSGLSIVSEYMSSVGGEFLIEDNIENGTVVTLQLPRISKRKDSIKRSDADEHYSNEQLFTLLKDRQKDLLVLAANHDELGPTLVNEILGIPVSTAYRDLNLLEKYGLIEAASSNSKQISARGLLYLKAGL